MLRRALWVVLRPLIQLITNLINPEIGEEWLRELNKFVRKEPCWIAVTAKATEATPKSILEFVSTSISPATTEPFDAKVKFVRDTSDQAKAKISGLGGNFTAWFLGDDGKIEQPMPASTIHCYRLKKRSVDGPIIKEFGGEEKVETTLAEIYGKMEREELSKDKWYTFYVRDKNAVLRAVYVNWHGGGWDVGAHSTDYSGPWYVDDHFFSRNLVLTSSVPQESVAS